MKVKTINGHVQKSTALKWAKDYANWCNCLKDIGNRNSGFASFLSEKLSWFYR